MKDINDIIMFIEEYFEENGVLTKEDQIANFVGELEKQISEMDFSVPDGSTIILYTGESNGIGAWEIAKKTSEILGDNARYISELPAGQLLNDDDFKKSFLKLFGNDTDVISKVVSGYSNNVRLEGGSCGYGDYVSLDDFVSGMFVSKSTNASNNLIVICPEQVDSRKVFPVTEMLEAFSSSTYEYINGIPKSQLKAFYINVVG